MSIADALDPWQTRSACRPADARLFDPPGRKLTEAQAAAHYQPAAAICGRCSTRAECLTEARRLRVDGYRAGVLLENGRRRRLA